MRSGDVCASLDTARHNAVTAEYTISHKIFAAGKMQTSLIIQNTYIPSAGKVQKFSVLQNVDSYHWALNA
jgi:hypothetical protein